MRDPNESTASGFVRLHDLAAAFGDGLLPELHDLLARQLADEPDPTNVIPWRRQTGGEPAQALRHRSGKTAV